MCDAQRTNLFYVPTKKPKKKKGNTSETPRLFSCFHSENQCRLHLVLCVFVCMCACTWHAPVDRCSSQVLLLQIFYHPPPPPASPLLFAQRLGAIIGAHAARCSNLCGAHKRRAARQQGVLGWANPQAHSCTAACRAHTQTHSRWSTHHFLRVSSWTLRHFYWVLSLIGQTLDFGLIVTLVMT